METEIETVLIYIKPDISYCVREIGFIRNNIYEDYKKTRSLLLHIN